MTQNTYGPINPQTTDGLALATELDQFWENFRSGNSGPTAPPYIQAGGLWFELPPTGPRRLMLRNGGADIPILEVNSGIAKLAPGIAAIEPGTIMMWYGTPATIPAGWAYCNGATYPREDGAGNIQSPNLRGRFIVGSGGGNPPGDEGGEAENAALKTDAGGAHNHGRTGPGGAHSHGGDTDPHTLTEAQMPTHHHLIVSTGTGNFDSDPAPNNARSIDYRATGTGQKEYQMTRASANYGTVGRSSQEGGNASHRHGIPADPGHDHNIPSASDHEHDYAAHWPAFTALVFMMKL